MSAGIGELPPPAYSEQEDYDRKTSHAIELSLATNSQQGQQEEEEWEEWDEAKFEEAVCARAPRQQESERPSSNSSTNLSAVRALPSLPQHSGSSASRSQALHVPRVDEKKPVSKVPELQSVKPRPSWYEEAGLADSSAGSSTGSTYSRFTSSSSTSSSSSGYRPPHLMVHNFTPEDEVDDDDDSAPPPFTPGVQSAPSSLGGIPVGDVITLSYNGTSNPNHFSRLGPPPGTPPPSSRLIFPFAPEPAGPEPAVRTTNTSSNRALLQVEPLRPRTASNVQTPSYNLGPPVRMSFDPNVAYSKKPVEKRDSPPSPSTPFNVLSLYSSSVSAVLESSSHRFNRPQASSGTQKTDFPPYISPPVSPMPMYAAVTPPPLSNQNATQFPLHPSFTPDLNTTNPYQYPRWASSEQQFSHSR
ncbi:hypothetical protein D9758_001022 [Tetrapyrgos nigripes]|uniref:Uncharacterized protein n=1 Tax=Tetrapyrgos nigripes TaxID=182062 RepID=A0A8H5LUK8_9AGAR|nr:hypothetical protein D9758_001022 [Tetrapyrgos nigripes]